MVEVEEREEDEDAIDPMQDPWNLVRLAMGSLAGTPWRLRQALVRPSEAFDLLCPPGVSHLEQFKRTQGFDAFCAAMPFRPNSTKGVIDIVLVGEAWAMRDSIHLDAVLSHLESFCGFKVVLRPEHVALGDWAHPREVEGKKRIMQYGAHFILANLKQSLDPRSTCTLAVTPTDLYPPRAYQYVTGMADASQRVGLFSYHRYYSDAGDRNDPDVQIKRTMCLIMTLCRETLKLCGMGECNLLKCLMNPVPRGPPEGIRNLPLSLCCICLRKLHWLTQNDLLDRYAALPAVLGEFFEEETWWLWDRMVQVGMPTYASIRDDSKKRGGRLGGL